MVNCDICKKSTNRRKKIDYKGNSFMLCNRCYSIMKDSKQKNIPIRLKDFYTQGQQQSQIQKQQSQRQNKRIVYSGNPKELVFKLLSKDDMGIQIFLIDLDEQLDNVKQYYKNYWKKNGNYKLLQHVWKNSKYLVNIKSEHFVIYLSFEDENMTKIITGHIEDFEEVEMSEPHSLYNIICDCIGVYNW